MDNSDFIDDDQDGVDYYDPDAMTTYGAYAYFIFTK
jgi:hypothetical protein